MDNAEDVDEFENINPVVNYDLDQDHELDPSPIRKRRGLAKNWMKLAEYD